MFGVYADVLLGLVCGVFGSSLFFFNRMRGLEKTRDELKIRLNTKTENDLTVVAFPYKEEHGDDGWVSDDRVAKIGYQYQLFVKGIPCFEPHKVTLETLTKKEVSSEKIEQAIGQALRVIEAIASKHPAIQVVKEAAKVSKA